MKLKFFIFYNIVIIIIFFVLIEIFFKLYFNQTKRFDCYTKVEDIRKYTNQINCNFKEKYFEKEKPTFYFTNKDGIRVGKEKIDISDKEKIFFVGDSFTFGYLSNYEFTYPYVAIQKINNKSQKKFIENNYGVNGYQIDEVLYLINQSEIKNTKNYIIYGLTPNDLFDINEKKLNIEKRYNLVDSLKILIDKLDLISIKYFSSKILNNEKIYTKLYKKRGSKSGYLSHNSSLEWDKKYEIFKEKINKLPKEIRNRLIITIIPQQIQIKLLQQNLINEGLAFDRKILDICLNLKIKCISKTLELAKIHDYKTHFVIDGHLIPEANRTYGELISKDLIQKLNVEKNNND